MASAFDAQIVLIFAVFVGALSFMSVSAIDTIPALGNISGTDSYENYSSDGTAISSTDYLNKSAVVREGDVWVYDGTTNDRGEEYGYIRYEVSGIDQLTAEIYATLFSPMEVAYYNSTNDLYGGRYIQGDVFIYDAQSVADQFGEEAYILELRMDKDFHEVGDISIPEKNEGLISQTKNLFNIFTGLSSSTTWFNLLIGIPMGMVGLYLLIKLIARILPG